MKAVIKRAALPALTRHTTFEFTTSKALGGAFLLLTVVMLFSFGASQARAQEEGTYSIWGDIKIDDSQADTPAPLTLTVILYDERGVTIGRQVVTNRGRYRFNNLQRGQYDLVVEGEMGEITRARIPVFGATGADFRQDFEFQWKSKVTEPKAITGIISAADAYERSSANKALFQKAQKAAEKKKYSEAALLLRQIVENDKQDFQAWSLLGTIYLAQDKPDEAEKAYLKAIEVRPTFGLALLNLGRLRASQKRFDEAIDPLTRAVQAQPQSASANLLLGEAYLQIKKGSKAIPYLNEAAKLGLVEAHLRLAWLYNAAGLKDKAAAEYEEFLKKKPQYPDRKKLEQYISANKKAKSSS